jgi:adenosine deaminase
MCPLSNLALKVVERLEDHPIVAMFELGLLVSVNSDDPAYFGGYVGDNYLALESALALGADNLVDLARNSVTSSFLAAERKRELLTEIDAVLAGHQG